MLLRVVSASRFLLVVPVIGCLLLTFGVVLMGFARIVAAGFNLLQAGDFSPKTAKTMSLVVIKIIDLFLIGTVAYITAAGLYKLFTSNSEIRVWSIQRGAP